MVSNRALAFRLKECMRLKIADKIIYECLKYKTTKPVTFIFLYPDSEIQTTLDTELTIIYFIYHSNPTNPQLYVLFFYYLNPMNPLILYFIYYINPMNPLFYALLII